MPGTYKELIEYSTRIDEATHPDVIPHVGAILAKHKLPIPNIRRMVKEFSSEVTTINVHSNTVFLGDNVFSSLGLTSPELSALIITEAIHHQRGQKGFFSHLIHKQHNYDLEAARLLGEDCIHLVTALRKINAHEKRHHHHYSALSHIDLKLGALHEQLKGPHQYGRGSCEKRIADIMKYLADPSANTSAMKDFPGRG